MSAIDQVEDEVAEVPVHAESVSIVDCELVHHIVHVHAFSANGRVDISISGVGSSAEREGGLSLVPIEVDLVDILLFSGVQDLTIIIQISAVGSPGSSASGVTVDKELNWLLLEIISLHGSEILGILDWNDVSTSQV